MCVVCKKFRKNLANFDGRKTEMLSDISGAR